VPRPCKTTGAFISVALAATVTLASTSAEPLERLSGTLSCSKSAFAPAARREPVTAELKSNLVRYRHTVLDDEGTAGMGVETGEGTIGKDGRLTLNGIWRSHSAGYAYDARYSGTLGPKGGEFSGHQVWTIQGRKAERSCTMTLSRAGRGFLR